MRISVLVTVVVLHTLPAFANPEAQPAPRPCAVTIVRAPDQVRKAIETWVRAESHCTTSLEVRVVPTPGGLYLLARDDAGRVRERVVPDAQSVGVLVASWIADDAPVTPPAAPPVPPPASAPAEPPAEAPAAPPASPPVTPAVAPPATGATGAPAPPPAEPPAAMTPATSSRVASMTPLTDAAHDRAAPAGPGASAPREGSIRDTATPVDGGDSRWLTIAGVADVKGHSDAGARLELDVLGGHHWAAGLAGATLNSSESPLQQQTMTAIAYVAGTVGYRDWQVRLAVGGGGNLIRSRNYVDYAYLAFSPGQQLTVLREVVEGELAVTLRLPHRWAVAAGVLVSSSLTRYEDEDSYRASLMVLGGLRYRL